MLMVALGLIIDKATETHTAARSIKDQEAYRRLGLTDAAILSVTRPGMRLLTIDEELWREALALGQTAFNFKIVREQERRRSP